MYPVIPTYNRNYYRFSILEYASHPTRRYVVVRNTSRTPPDIPPVNHHEEIGAYKTREDAMLVIEGMKALINPDFILDGSL